MASLKQLKEKRQSVNKTRKVTRAMEAVSAVKMRKSQERALAARGYAFAALAIMEHVFEAGVLMKAPLAKPRDTGKIGIILVTSDKGLAGSLNSAVIKHVETFLEKSAATGADVEAIVLGKRGNEYLKRMGAHVRMFRENRKDEVSEREMREIVDVALEVHLSGETRSWHIFYTNFQSTFEQRPQELQLFPLNPEAVRALVMDIAPARGKYHEVAGEVASYTAVSDYLVEAHTQKDIVSFLVPMLVTVMVYHALLESKASEHSARMVAMKNATDKAGEMSHLLQLQFNKARQAAITREVSEITSGIEAMK